MKDWIGEQVSHYQVIRLLERETMLERYLGSNVSSRQEVTLYLLAEPGDELSIRRFQRNIPIMQSLTHPCIAPLLDIGIQEKTPFVVLDYLPTSRQFHPFPLPLPTVIKYAEQLIEALDFAHGKGIIHRALSPEAILLGKQGEILLGDFYLPVLRAASSKPLEKSLLTLAAYPAPEQYNGSPADACTDQYMLALIIYEWLCGVPPFQGPTPIERALQHIQVAPPPLREKAPQLPLELEPVIQRALAKRPGERFATLKAFGTALLEASQATAP
ncbi:MAG TPA: serine/threonine-protein kinase [Ktedonobacteraceae bacterium]